jgi:hypothetical protein
VPDTEMQVLLRTPLPTQRRMMVGHRHLYVSLS